MALPSEQLQLLFQRQQQRFKKNRLKFIDKFHTRLLNHPCFEDVTELSELISKSRTQLENDCRMNECVSEGLHESVIKTKQYQSYMIRSVVDLFRSSTLRQVFYLRLLDFRWFS
ncbi:unnamed protein product [Schistosoma mattheei]|uniref:Uncharacterized protein n=1 Tax=Schistosoma mattheei TaxID=31246 RepID=A0AA85BQB9_9TREM|nr:unnamed protein product [Schistosoma mattheei]